MPSFPVRPASAAGLVQRSIRGLDLPSGSLRESDSRAAAVGADAVQFGQDNHLAGHVQSPASMVGRPEVARMPRLMAPQGEAAGRYTQEVPGDTRLIDQHGAADSTFQPAPRGRDDRSGGDVNSTQAAQAAREIEIFHDRQIRKSADATERFRSQEDCLVAVWHLEVARSPIREHFDQPQGSMRGVDAKAKGSRAHRSLCKYTADVLMEARRQTRVRMQEEQDLAGCDRGAGVELLSAAGRRRHDRHAECFSNLGRAIGTVAIDDDHFPWIGRQNMIKRLADIRFFVAGGDDDGDSIADSPLADLGLSRSPRVAGEVTAG